MLRRPILTTRTAARSGTPAQLSATSSACRWTANALDTHVPGCRISTPVFKLDRRTLLSGALVTVLTSGLVQEAPARAAGYATVGASEESVPPTGLPPVKQAVIKPQLAPDQMLYDPADPELRAAAALLQNALDAPDVATEEKLWTKLIDTYTGLDRNWVPDVVGRAWGNRGNSRSRQGKLAGALSDYNTAIDICPWSVDPVLNRGVVLEALGMYEDALRDYRSVLAVAPEDPAGWNNLGNASAGLGRYEDAAEFYGKAVRLAPQFSFAAANRAVALYEVGKVDVAVKEMRQLLRRYPDFDDMRASLAAALWALGKEGDAESNWMRVQDPRYKDTVWLKEARKWPPSLQTALANFLKLRSMA